jgi:hypothetical protein
MNRFRGQWSIYWGYFGFAVLGIGLALWQGIVYHDKTTGTVVSARVDDCQVDPVKGVDVTCTGTWPVGVSLPAGSRRTRGVIDGVDIPDMGRTVKVHLHGGRAYAQTRLVAPAVFFFIGILMALGFVGAAWRKAGASRRTPATTAGLPAG